MSISISTVRTLIETVADIGTAVRASREYSRLSVEARSTRKDRPAVSGLLPR